ncbi:MAG: CapA family protein [Candidatus Humimicrobiaceae bacterium]
MKNIRIKKFFLKQIVLFCLIFIIVLCPGLFSCSYINSSDSGKTTPENIISQTSENSNEKDETQGNADIAAGDTSKEEDNGIQEKAEIRLLIKDAVPLFASAVIRHEAKNLFNDTGIIEDKEQELENGPDSHDVVVDIDNPQSDSENFIIYCAVTGFFNICDNISISDFKSYWEGLSQTIGSISEIVDVGKSGGKYSNKNYAKEDKDKQNNSYPLSRTVLFLTKETKKILSVQYGEPKNTNILTVNSNEIQAGIENNPNSFAIVPFEELRKELKVLNIDAKSIFDKEFSYETYPFSFSIVFKGINMEKAAELKKAFENIFYSNMDPGKMAVVNMTGVTALVRGVANRMDAKGVLYPGEKIADTLKNGDIIHTSNEISFKEGCNAGQSGTTFCSKPEYIELLKYVGINLVELTGNHLNDFGSSFLEDTIKMYNELGWKYFGGGPNLALSKNPALYEINGNKIAFIGFNQFGPEYDWATRTDAGSAPPDNAYFLSKVKSLKEAGYNVIFTFQYEESYNYFPLDRQVEDFRMLRDAGADIVNGSQAHQPMGFEITKNGLICYGLGNIFFDQMGSIGTRQGIIAKHIFYNGRHISTQLIPTIIDDYCQPRLMDETEKKELLRSLFEASLKS